MSAKKISVFLKTLPTFTDMSGKTVILKDSEGNLGASAISTILPIRAGNKTGFANVFPDFGLYLCSMYSESDRFVNCVFTVLYVKKDAIDNRSPIKILDTQGGLSVSVNAYGTVTPIMTSGALPTDLKLLYLGVKV